MIREAVGDTRLHELRARGEAMDWNQTSAYACAHIDELLTSAAEQ
jgi:hypothetical protein